ncbi:MAG: Phosphoribosyl transferase domain protein, partial [Rhodospirillales bacterium]|nr:Phosphoribosyl transferase domain protein [Rhodospirillales bacterium]
FGNRRQAGRKLAQQLLAYRNLFPIVLALPRGGILVGFEVAAALGTSLDIVLVQKIGMPSQPELALGAVVDGDHPEFVFNEWLKDELEIPDAYVRQESDRQQQEIARRRKIYPEGRPSLSISQRPIIVVDDGIATGATMRAALRAIRRQRPSSIALAVPVASPDAVELLRPEVDDLVCLSIPPTFSHVGKYYREFEQVDDKTVAALLRGRST